MEDLNKMMGNSCSGLARKSQNMTECVPVPTSEHVAEIVGRQGKISIHYYFKKLTYCSVSKNEFHRIEL